MPFSLRLDPQTEALIRRLAESSKQSKSAVVRDAVARRAAAQAAETAFTVSTLERLRSFVGIVSTESQGSADTHANYRASLEQKHRGRRSR